MTIVLVTGGTGFLASNTIRALLDKGYSVRSTARDANSPKAAFLKEWGVDVRSADLMKADGWEEAVEGVDYVLHMASPFKTKFKNDDELVKPAVNGVTHVFEAMKGKKIKKAVITSSVAAMMAGHDAKYIENNVLDEDIWSDVSNAKGYELSKTLAERKAWELAKEYDIKLDAVNPGLIMGPLYAEHHKDCESSRLIHMMTTQFVAPDIRCPFVSARDVAECHIRAMERDAHGDRFICAADNGLETSFMDLAVAFNKLSNLTSARCGTMSVPNVLVRVMGFFMSDVKSIVPFLGMVVRCTNAKSKETLTMTYRPFEDGLEEHVKSLVEYGVIPKAVPSKTAS